MLPSPMTFSVADALSDCAHAAVSARLDSVGVWQISIEKLYNDIFRALRAPDGAAGQGLCLQPARARALQLLTWLP